jgi:acyl-CoA oxidase
MDDPGANMAAFETLGLGNLSALIKFGVPVRPPGRAVHHLGQRRHHERFPCQIATLELPGCFAMTVAAHGSDVQHRQTTATYDAETHEFAIHTPADEAHQERIGNAAVHGVMAAVFAWLVVGDASHWVQALVVPIRDRDGILCDGVRIEDCGEKLGIPDEILRAPIGLRGPAPADR